MQGEAVQKIILPLRIPQGTCKGKTKKEVVTKRERHALGFTGKVVSFINLFVRELGCEIMFLTNAKVKYEFILLIHLMPYINPILH